MFCQKKTKLSAVVVQKYADKIGSNNPFMGLESFRLLEIGKAFGVNKPRATGKWRTLLMNGTENRFGSAFANLIESSPVLNIL